MVNIATTFTATWVYIATGQPEIHSDAMSQKHKGKEKEKENMCKFQFEEKKNSEFKSTFHSALLEYFLSSSIIFQNNNKNEETKTRTRNSTILLLLLHIVLWF